MKTYLLLIDWPKGSGKSTTIEWLKKSLSNTDFSSLDGMRSLVKKDTKDADSSTENSKRDSDNTKAFELLADHLKEVFERKENAVVDSGLSEGRVDIFDTIANKYDIKVYKFSLTAPYEVLRLRVMERDVSKGKVFDQNRFDYTFKAQQGKSFENFEIIDSNKFSPQEISEMIYLKITQMPNG